VLAVGALAVAVGTLLWVLSGIGSSSTSGTTSTPSTHASTTSTQPGGGTTTKPKSHPSVSWKQIPLTILNGYSATAPAASDAQTTLRAAGWTVNSINNTQPQTTTATYVAYPPGQLAAAKVVAHRLHLPKPVPISQAAGVDPTLATVVIVLGPNGLPAGG
jgi:LytR cell envelope-related transcriptional attenuator